MDKNKQIGKSARESKPPWYYYVLGTILYGVISTALKMGTGVKLGVLPAALLTVFCVYFLPRSFWSGKNGE